MASSIDVSTNIRRAFGTFSRGSKPKFQIDEEFLNEGCGWENSQQSSSGTRASSRNEKEKNGKVISNKEDQEVDGWHGWTNGSGCQTTFLGEIERRNRFGRNEQQNGLGKYSKQWRSQSRGRDRGQGRREKFLPPKTEEWELFDENKQVQEGEMFNEICEVYEEAITVLNSDGSEVDIELIENFEQCGLSREVLLNVQLKKLKKPSPIQRVVIPLIMERHEDLVGHAQTGSGKTAAFLLPIINNLQSVVNKRRRIPNSNSPYTIIISPTKELVKQLFDDALAFSLRTGVSICYTFGDMPMKASLESLAAGCDIFITTCGRLKQFVDEEYISLDELHFLVLDEADRLLKKDPFYNCIKEIKEHNKINPKHRVLMFSATYEHSVNVLVQNFLRDDFVQVQIGQINSAADTVEQTFLQVKKHSANGEKGKQDTLIDFLLRHEKTCLVPQVNGEDYWKVPKTIVFVEQKRQSYRLGLALNHNNIRAYSYNSDLTLKMRYEAVSRFASNHCDVLVATDVGARGLNFPNVQYVINFELPLRDLRDAQNEYIHRIGRTGRIGNVGAAISYFDPTSVNDRRNAGYFIKVLKDSKQSIPDWLFEIAFEKHLDFDSADDLGTAKERSEMVSQQKEGDRNTDGNNDAKELRDTNTSGSS